ncbi:MAG: NTE family protein [Verrucomicrobiales bacterium]|jgi:NTE family protein
MPATENIPAGGFADFSPSLIPLNSRRNHRSRPKIGLALSSGGAKGLAHIGVIQVLEEYGVKIDAIAGSSMGAYVGSCWAAGCDGFELEELAARMSSSRDRLKLLDPILPPRTGFIRGLKVKNRLMRTVGERTFDELKRKLIVVASVLETHETKVFSGDSLVADAVHASLAIPGICAPVEIDGTTYVDGGVTEPLPVQPLLDLGMDRVIAVSVVPSVEDLKACRDRRFDRPKKRGFWSSIGRFLNKHLNYFAEGNILDILRRSSTCGQIRMAEFSAEIADLCLHPAVCADSWQDYHHYRAYVEQGRIAAEANIDRILALTSPTLPAAAGRKNLHLNTSRP